MSIDLNWEAATSGPDGEELAERIRSFIHDKFQTVPLPRFIRSVNVHSFEFGSIAPELEIKDICDPFVDFYEEDESGEEEEDDDDDDDDDTTSNTSPSQSSTTANQRGTSRREDEQYGISGQNNATQDFLRTTQWVTGQGNSHQSPLRSPIGLADHLNAQFRSSTPTILPGVTSNLGYHLMMGSLSGTQTPLGAVTGTTPFATGWPDAVVNNSGGGSISRTITGASAGGAGRGVSLGRGRDNNESPPSRPSTANTNPTHLSHGRSAAGSSSNNTSNDPTVIYNETTSSVATAKTKMPMSAHTPKDGEQTARDKQSSIMADLHEETTTPHMRERRPEDFQIICRVKYSGDVKLSLTAEILLDYPMPSFVGLPLKLNITGITFDGVAVVAYIRRRTHLCFLSPEDADALLGDENDDDGDAEDHHQLHRQDQQQFQDHAHTKISDDDNNKIYNAASNHNNDNDNNIINKSSNSNKNNDNERLRRQPKRRYGSLLQQIRVESEIGRKENGKQVLKNVGKVERFVLDQVRRIFEDEFIFPSFWTFLV